MTTSRQRKGAARHRGALVMLLRRRGPIVAGRVTACFRQNGYFRTV
jgi:hypothetical protein